MRFFRLPVYPTSRFLIAIVLVAMAVAVTPAWALTVEQEVKLLAGDSVGWDLFGRSVAIDGNTAVIGAPSYHDNGSGLGAAYVFTRTGGVWTQQAKLLAADGAANDLFGTRVALDGDTAIVGAEEDDDNGENSGSASVPPTCSF